MKHDFPTDPEEVERLARTRIDELMSEQAKRVSLNQYGGGDAGLRAMREKIGDVRKLGHAEEGIQAVVEGADSPEQQQIVDLVVEGLRQIYDPEIPLNIYDLGLIYKLQINRDNAVRVEMTLTAPGCPVAGEIVENVRRKVAGVEGVSGTEVVLVWEPAWTRERLSEAARLELGLM